MGLKDASTLSIDCAVILVVAVVVQMAGIGTPMWLLTSCSVGLWDYCSFTECKSIAVVPAWLHMTRMFSLLGLFVLAATAVLHCVCVFKFTRGDETKNKFRKITFGLAFGAGALIMLSIVIVAATHDGGFSKDPCSGGKSGSSSNSQLGYSYKMSAVGGCMGLFTGFLLVVDFVLRAS